jgi:hypothetical protein
VKYLDDLKPRELSYIYILRAHMAYAVCALNILDSLISKKLVYYLML